MILIIRPNMAFVLCAAFGACTDIGSTAYRAFKDGFVWLQEHADFVDLNQVIRICGASWRHEVMTDNNVFSWQFCYKYIFQEFGFHAPYFSTRVIS